jgi:glycosyltransferase involved in cell wall biosynthesis
MFSMPLIAHLTTVHLPFDTRIFQRECISLVEAGYRVSLIVQHTHVENVGGVNLINIPRFNSRISRALLAPLGAYFHARRLKADLYHFHDPELMPVGILLKYTTRAKVIYDVHENYPENILSKEWIAWPLRKVFSKCIELLERVTGFVVDGIVAATEHIGTRFPSKKTCIVRNFPLLAQSNRADVQRVYEGNNRLIYTGGISPHRGILQIVQSLAYVKTPGARLILLGRIIDQRIWETIQKMPGFERVDYLGQVSFDEMYRYLYASAVGLICNQPAHDFDLALPNKLFEYMSAGLPIVASDFELWRSVVADNDCGIMVDPTDPMDIARGIDTLLSHSEERRRLGSNARRAAEMKYDWAQERKKLYDVYQELLDNDKK